MTITLPDELREKLERDARAAGFATVDEYAAEVLRAADGFDPDDPDDPFVPEELRIKNRADLEAKLLEGLNSGPPILVTPEFWADLRERVKRQAEAAGRAPPT